MGFEIDFLFSSFKSAVLVSLVLLALVPRRLNREFEQRNLYRAVVGFACLSYVFFLVAWIDWFLTEGIIVSIAAYGLLIVAVIRILRNPPSRQMCEVVGMGVVATVMINCIALWRGVVDVSQGVQHTIAVRYWASADNLLPARMSEGLLNNVPLRPYLLGDWLSSDRPPLLSGVHLMFRHLEQEPFFILSAVTVLVLVVTYSIFLRESGKHSLSIMAALTLCFVPGIFINEIYTWPKLLAGVLSLIAIDLVLSRHSSNGIIALSSISLTMGLLTHGSTFFVVPMFILFVVVREKPRLAEFLSVGTKCFAVYLPWLLYQRLFDPPGTRLLIWHIAGKIDSVSTDNPISVIMRAYQDAGFSNVLDYKLSNLLSLFWVWERNPAIVGYEGLLGLLKTQMTSSVLWSVGPTLVVAVLTLSFGYISVYVKKMLTALAAICLVFAILEMGADINSRATLHVSPLLLTLGFSLLGILSIMRLRHQWIVYALFATIPIGTFTLFGLFHGPAEAVGWRVNQTMNYLGYVSATLLLASWAYLIVRSREPD